MNLYARSLVFTVLQGFDKKKDLKSVLFNTLLEKCIKPLKSVLLFCFRWFAKQTGNLMIFSCKTVTVGGMQNFLSIVCEPILIYYAPFS